MEMPKHPTAILTEAITGHSRANLGIQSRAVNSDLMRYHLTGQFNFFTIDESTLRENPAPLES